MFAAAHNPLLAHRLIESTCVAHHLFDSFAVASAKQRILGVIVEGNVEDGAKIEIEPKNAQQASGDVAVSPDQIDVVFVAQLLRVRRFASDASESRYASAFLINCDDWLDVAQVAQIVDKLSELGRAVQTASEKNICPRLYPLKQTRCFCIEFFSGNTRHDQLTKRIALHGGQR